jgi:hypothetical protein
VENNLTVAQATALKKWLDRNFDWTRGTITLNRKTVEMLIEDAILIATQVTRGF